ncbi:discoidin domain-containing protein [Massilia sp. 9I]|uniref:discoidin domain-containing protein n=1 Tax=Massilia sp. 9I TaxID=2653152 RepID=UPI0012F0B59F|nr:discoidin domain-containing protein [Massilia sp. 9I]VXC07028.1 PEP-CTERM domain protein [Massilia sp. 9I]
MSKLFLALAILVSVLGSSAEAATIRAPLGNGGLVGGDLTDPENNGDPEQNVGYNATFRSSIEQGFGGGEYAFNVFDNQVGGGNDKWCCDTNVWVEANFGTQRYTLTSFTASSANDVPERDSNHWQILGSNDGINYTPIFTYNATNSVWTNRLQTVQFFAGTDYLLPSAYSIFRYQSTSVVSGSMHQLAELEFFGTPAQVPEPASLLLMGLGALGFAGRRKRA